MKYDSIDFAILEGGEFSEEVAYGRLEDPVAGGWDLRVLVGSNFRHPDQLGWWIPHRFPVADPKSFESAELDVAHGGDQESGGGGKLGEPQSDGVWAAPLILSRHFECPLS
jgi:hypothetical protein